MRKPGMASSLSSVPPVCPSPRPGHLRHHDAARGHQRREHDRHLVADPAGAVLADLHARNRRQIDARARAHHRVGEPGGLLGAHAADHNRHQQRRRLIVLPRAVRQPGHEAVDGLSGKRLAVSFGANDVNGSHQLGLARFARSWGTAASPPRRSRRFAPPRTRSLTLAREKRSQRNANAAERPRPQEAAMSRRLSRGAKRRAHEGAQRPSLSAAAQYIVMPRCRGRPLHPSPPRRRRG